ncbi:hypothetical protein H6H03_25135 [Nostoc paludosum FACHB-159]|uniref:Uncharacterized protein n=1 Tax=Nostoc paludosum FACHB-159 TaxID=2692908 RepID=A0ABR8KE62_9NOSO|nr:hypothetical protein [Nostoc paludosum FACHB-159]
MATGNWALEGAGGVGGWGRNISSLSFHTPVSPLPCLPLAQSPVPNSQSDGYRSATGL